MFDQLTPSLIIDSHHATWLRSDISFITVMFYFNHCQKITVSNINIFETFYSSQTMVSENIINFN